MKALTQYGRMAEKHWREHRPKMVRELERKGHLHPMLLEAEEKTKDEMVDAANAIDQAGIDAATGARPGVGNGAGEIHPAAARRAKRRHRHRRPAEESQQLSHHRGRPAGRRRTEAEVSTKSQGHPNTCGRWMPKNVRRPGGKSAAGQICRLGRDAPGVRRGQSRTGARNKSGFREICPTRNTVPPAPPPSTPITPRPSSSAPCIKRRQRFGFQGGRVLEPACGIGHFIGLMPEDDAATLDHHRH